MLRTRHLVLDSELQCGPSSRRARSTVPSTYAAQKKLSKQNATALRQESRFVYYVCFNCIVCFPGKVVQNIFGKCTEALYCGDGLSSRLIWRPCTLPEDNAVFYGFSRFAVELNEVSSNERGLLPPTDTRFRPDQRCLEVS